MVCPDTRAIAYAKNSLNIQRPKMGKGDEQVWRQLFLLFFHASLFPINQKVRNRFFFPKKDLRRVRAWYKGQITDTTGGVRSRVWCPSGPRLVCILSPYLMVLKLPNNTIDYTSAAYFYQIWAWSEPESDPEQGSECLRSTHFLLLSVLHRSFLALSEITNLGNFISASQPAEKLSPVAFF